LSARPDWTVCGEAENGLEAIEKANSLRPDVVLMDVSMPGMDGFRATRMIRCQVPKSKVILVSQSESAVISQQAAEAGTAGFIPKSELPYALLAAAVDRVEAGQDGRKFSSDSLIRTQRSGVGITGMRERGRNLRGELDIQSSAAGTKILVSFPRAAAGQPEQQTAIARAVQ